MDMSNDNNNSTQTHPAGQAQISGSSTSEVATERAACSQPASTNVAIQSLAANSEKSSTPNTSGAQPATLKQAVPSGAGQSQSMTPTMFSSPGLQTAQATFWQQTTTAGTSQYQTAAQNAFAQHPCPTYSNSVSHDAEAHQLANLAANINAPQGLIWHNGDTPQDYVAQHQGQIQRPGQMQQPGHIQQSAHIQQQGQMNSTPNTSSYYMSQVPAHMMSRHKHMMQWPAQQSGRMASTYHPQMQQHQGLQQTQQILPTPPISRNNSCESAAVPNKGQALKGKLVQTQQRCTPNPAHAISNPNTCSSTQVNGALSLNHPAGTTYTPASTNQHGPQTGQVICANQNDATTTKNATGMALDESTLMMPQNIWDYEWYTNAQGCLATPDPVAMLARGVLEANGNTVVRYFPFNPALVSSLVAMPEFEKPIHNLLRLNTERAAHRVKVHYDQVLAENQRKTEDLNDKIKKLEEENSKLAMAKTEAETKYTKAHAFVVKLNTPCKELGGSEGFTVLNDLKSGRRFLRNNDDIKEIQDKATEELRARHANEVCSLRREKEREIESLKKKHSEKETEMKIIEKELLEKVEQKERRITKLNEDLALFSEARMQLDKDENGRKMEVLKAKHPDVFAKYGISDLVPVDMLDAGANTAASGPLKPVWYVLEAQRMKEEKEAARKAEAAKRAEEQEQAAREKQLEVKRKHEQLLADKRLAKEEAKRERDEAKRSSLLELKEMELEEKRKEREQRKADEAKRKQKEKEQRQQQKPLNKRKRSSEDDNTANANATQKKQKVSCAGLVENSDKSTYPEGFEDAWEEAWQQNESQSTASTPSGVEDLQMEDWDSGLFAESEESEEE